MMTLTKYFCWISFLILGFNSISQDQDTTICDFPDKEAQFPGGEVEMKRFITENLKWPAYEGSLIDKIYLKFIVEKDGTISHIQVLNSHRVEFTENGKALI